MITILPTVSDLQTQWQVYSNQFMHYKEIDIFKVIIFRYKKIT